MCNIAGCRCSTLWTHTSETWPLLLALQTALPLDPTKDASCVIGSLILAILPVCVELSPKLSCYPLHTEASQFNLLPSFLPDLYIHYLPTFASCQILSSLSDSLVPGSAVPWGYATLGCLQRSGPFPAVLFPRLTISRASLNKLCLKYITLSLGWEKPGRFKDNNHTDLNEDQRKVKSLLGCIGNFGFGPVWTLGVISHFLSNQVLPLPGNMHKKPHKSYL